MHGKKGQEGFTPTTRAIVIIILIAIVISAITFILVSFVKGMFGGAG